MIYEYEEIGRELKKIREEKGRTIEELVEEIKISEEYIKAIESGDLTELPSQIYYGLFVRSYCKELGLDADKFLNKYAAEEIPTDSDESGLKGDGEKPKKIEYPPLKEKPEASPFVLTLWIVGIIVVIIAAVYWFSKPGDTETESNEPMTQTETRTEVAKPVVDTTTIDTVVSEPEPPKPDPLRLNITVNELSWVYVMSDGDTVLNRNLDVGATRNLTADSMFIFSIGNPKGVSMILNGRPMRAISNTGRPILNEEINQINFEEYYLSAEPKPEVEDSVNVGD